MTSKQKEKAQLAIHAASVVAAGIAGGIVSLPVIGPVASLFDSAPIAAAQVTMIMELAKDFDVDITEATAKAILSATAATVGGRTASKFFTNLIPGINTAVNTTTAAAITEAIGWAVAEDFSNGKY